MSKEIDDLTATLAERKHTRSKLYSEVSSELKSAAITNDVSFKRQNLMTAAKRPRADLNDPEDVQQRTNEFLLACEQAAVVPTFLGLCASLGYTRQGLYHFLNRSPENPSAKFLELAREVLADALISSGLTRTTDSAVSIFALKNLHGFADKLEIEPVTTPQSPLGPLQDPEELRKRILASVVIDDLPED